MTPIHETGIHNRVQYAKRDDGQWFKRVQSKTPYGYRWSRWTEVHGDYSVHSVNPYAGKARLPK